MATPMRNCVKKSFSSFIRDTTRISQSQYGKSFNFTQIRTLKENKGDTSNSYFTRSKILKIGAVIVTVKVCIGGIVFGAKSMKKKSTVHASDGERPQFKPSRQVRVPGDSYGLKLTMYQFQTCPFCCKLRSVLDYYGFSYDVIEVNSVTKKQIKWSNYKKVPVLVCEGVGEKGFVQMNDSSVIISMLESYLVDRSQTVETLLECYPGIEGENDKGKKIIEYPNKYFIMYGERATDKKTLDERNKERKWRQWADDVFVHMLSPNVYRTPKESLETFRYFDKVGEWEKNFSTWERYLVIYVGASVMYVMGKIIKKRYNLREDVRESLYECCNFWMKNVGKNKFLGGDQPNLADLSVYGVLSSIEGCAAFQDVKDNTKIEGWYNNMKTACQNHMGLTSSPKR